MKRGKMRAAVDGGFTLIEVVVAISVLLICTLALGLCLQAGAVVARELREEQVILAQAQSIVDRMLAQDFGQTFDADPTSAQLEEIFDSDPYGGTITLQQLSRWPQTDGGWKFELTSFPVDGEWNVSIDTDLDGNGVVEGELETGGRVLRISVFFNERLILRTNRAKEVTL